MPVLKKKFISGVLNGKHYSRIYKNSKKIVDNYDVLEYSLIENTSSEAISTHLPAFFAMDDNAINYQEFVFTLKDGTTTKDRNTLISNVAKVTGYYNENHYNRITFEGLSYIQSIDKLNITSSITDMSNMFNGCSGLTSLNLSNWDTSNVTDMNHMFAYCENLTSLNLSTWNVSNVYSMNGMFVYCESLASLNVSNWDTGNLYDIAYMFERCSSLTSLDVSSFNTSNVTNMHYTFGTCSSLTSLDLSGWNTGNVTDMGSLFFKCSNLTSLNISNLDTSSVIDMSYMFSGCSSLTSLDLTNWNISSLRNVSNMLENCSMLSSIDLSTWDTSNIRVYMEMFIGCQQSCLGYYCPPIWTLPTSGEGFDIIWVSPFNEYTIDLALLDEPTVDLYQRLDNEPFTYWGDGTSNNLTTHTYTATSGEVTIYTNLFNSLPVSS